MSWYATEPRNLTQTEVDQRILAVLASQSSYGSYVPRGIPQIALDIPIVSYLPKAPEDGQEVYLRVGDGNQIAHMLYLRSIPGWVQVGNPPLVTSLPTSVAVEGMQIVYDTGTAGVRWNLVYDSSDGSTYPWLYIGGPPLMALVATQETRANTAYGALTTAGPSVTLPLAGDYDVRIGAKANNNTDGDGAMMSYDIGGTGAVDADSIEIFQAGATSVTATNSREKRKTGLTAAALTAKYRTTTGGTAAFWERSISAIPLRVG